MGPKVIFLLLVVGCGLGALGQSPSIPAADVDPTVTFTLDFPGSIPAHYSITVARSGQAFYDSGPASESPAASQSAKPNSEKDSDSDHESASDSTEAPFHYAFQIGEPNRTRIFDLAARARYFQGQLNYGKHNLANTGAKTLAYHDARINTSASYNYTTNQPAQQLTALFQNMSSTLEFARKLTFLYQHQKLALEEELKRMEEMARQNSLEELQAVSPILKQILADKSVINVTRARAERLLAMGAKTR